MTFDRFMNEIEQWESVFQKQMGIAINIIKLKPRRTEEVIRELSKRTATAESIVFKMEDFNIKMSMSQDNSDGNSGSNEVEMLLEEMQALIDSIGEYNR